MSPRLSCLLVAVLITTGAEAAQRTFVSAGSGSDANPCTRQAPCRNFALAMAQTDPDGEVVVLDSGGYGPVSIAQSASLISPPGVYAGITAFAQNAITVNVDNAVVVLRGLSLNGLGGANGILFTGQTSSASNTRLFVENCVISGFTNTGLNFARNGELFVSELIVRENIFGIFVDGSPTLPSNASIHRAVMDRNAQDGLRIQNATVAIRDSSGSRNIGGAAVFALASAVGAVANVSVENCQGTHNQDGFISGGGSGTARLTVSNSVASWNTLYGFWAATNSTIRATNNTATGNETGFLQSGTGVFRSAGDNIVDGNTTESSGTFAPIAPM